jgi:hypothetical protein
MLMMELKGIHPFRITEVRRGKRALMRISG